METATEDARTSGARALRTTLSDADAQVCLPVEGMTCDGCAKTVHLALGEVPGVREVDVDVDAGEVRLTGSAVDASEARRRVEVSGTADLHRASTRVAG